jgi:pre-rRNA-processing protein TSR1
LLYRYRGLKSFRSSPWDPKENLPLDYARIFQFENFNRSQKKGKAEIEADETAVQVSCCHYLLNYLKVDEYISIHIANVPQHFTRMIILLYN